MNPELRCVVCEEWQPTLYIVGGIPFCEKHYNAEIVSRAKYIAGMAVAKRRRKQF